MIKMSSNCSETLIYKSQLNNVYHEHIAMYIMQTVMMNVMNTHIANVIIIRVLWQIWQIMWQMP